MPYNLEEIRTELFRHGYQKQHGYEVQIGLPPALLKTSHRFMPGEQPSPGISVYDGEKMPPLETNRMLTLRADTCKLPGVLMATQMTQRYGIGPVRKHAISGVFTDVPITFIVDRAGYIPSFFYQWVNEIFNFGKSEGVLNSDSLGGRVPSYEIEYPYRYTTNIKIFVYDVKGDQVEEYELYHAYPTLVADRPIGWGMINSLQRLMVTFTFQEWSMIYNRGLGQQSGDSI